MYTEKKYFHHGSVEIDLQEFSLRCSYKHYFGICSNFYHFSSALLMLTNSSVDVSEVFKQQLSASIAAALSLFVGFPSFPW